MGKKVAVIPNKDGVTVFRSYAGLTADECAEAATGKKPNALHSLYGEGHANATRTRECVAMPGKREQTILTPQCIVDGLERFWPEGVVMDPCPAPAEEGSGLPNQVFLACEYAVNGLASPWPRKTYCNPPYGELKKWLEHGSQFDEVVWLVPIRLHRKWFRKWWTELDVRIALDPLKFHGFKQAYPAPLALCYKGFSCVRFHSSFEHLGGEV